MDGEIRLVSSLVGRLATRLPYRTGSSTQDLTKDEVFSQTTATLVAISSTCLNSIVDSLLSLLEELLKEYKDIQTQPPHITISELHILRVLADCFSYHWLELNRPEGSPAGGDRADDSRSSPQRGHASTTQFAENSGWFINAKALAISPHPLDEPLASRVLETIKCFLLPFHDQFILPTASILHVGKYSLRHELRTSLDEGLGSRNEPLRMTRDSTPGSGSELDEAEVQCRRIVEFVSASNWVMVLEHLRASLRLLQITYPPQSTGAHRNPSIEDERKAQATLRIVEYLWVDIDKLGFVLAEFCACFFHLQKTFQNTLTIVLPALIVTWVERHPEEFVHHHTSHSSATSGADRLFDIASGLVDSGRSKAIVYPLQMSLLLLIPDVFELATSMPTANRYTENGTFPKAGSPIFKKIAFLDSVRKALRNRMPAAAFSLLLMLRTARHFRLESSDSAFLSYATEVEDDLTEAIFKNAASSKDLVLFDDMLLTTMFVSLAYSDIETCSTRITPRCLAPNAPIQFRLAFVSACLFLARQPERHIFSSLFMNASIIIKKHLKLVWSDAIEAGRTDTTALGMRSVSEIEFCLKCVEFLGALTLAPPDDSHQLMQYEDSADVAFSILVDCLISTDDKIRHTAEDIKMSILKDGSVFSLCNATGIVKAEYARSIWQWTSVTLSNALKADLASNRQSNAVLSFVHDFLKARLIAMKAAEADFLPYADLPARQDCMARLESFVLIQMCAPDISTCQTATACLGLLCGEVAVFDAASETIKSPSSVLKNLDVYQELSSRDFRFTGLIAFQKRYRALLRRLRFSCPAILNAWESVFGAWHGCSKRFTSMKMSDPLEERNFAEWRNQTGFLSSLAILCVSTQSAPMDEATPNYHWIDQSSNDNQSECLLDRYMTMCVQLMSSSNVRVREATREVLSLELSPSLFTSLLPPLEANLEGVFNVPREKFMPFSEVQIAFCEQAAYLLKAVLERWEAPLDASETLSTDVGALALSFAKFLNNVADGVPITRMKIRVCQLCEAIVRKREHLNIRHDIRIRNQLMETIFGWIARPGSPGTIVHDGVNKEDAIRLQKELDKACLKSLSELTFRLALQPPDGQTDADTSDLKSEMFRTYFNRFLSLLSLESLEQQKSDAVSLASAREESLSTHDLAITALSNLLSANVDVGLKHSLGIGYHEDLEIRTAFIAVLCNVLAQGAEFSNLSDASVREKYSDLVDALVNDIPLTIALCDACPSTEVDELTMSLLSIFDSRGLGFVLLEALIRHEVMETENEAELLRRNCVTTKMLSVYARWKGGAYLKSTLQKVINRLILTSHDLDLELDPARTTSTDELQRNALQLRIVTKVFIEDICNSAQDVPISFRKICSIISSAVTSRFEEARFTAVGAFIFLRFFCPAIVAPDAEGLTDTKPSKEMRRGLLLIAKIIQNLANNVLFGAKEAYMFPLNDFLTQNIYRVTAFLREISIPPKLDNPVVETAVFDFGACVAMHRFLYDNWDQVLQRLTSHHQKGFNQTFDAGLTEKEDLRRLIGNIGPPSMNISWNRPLISLNNPPTYSRFQQFMLEHAGKSAESDITTRAVYDGGESKDGISIICIILRNIDSETIDYDLLLYCFLKIASRMWHKPFGILVDVTCYSGQNEPQDALFKKLELLAPTELSKNMGRVYIYNMNSAFRKCFRRILRLSMKTDGGVFHPERVDYHLIGTLQELQSHFHMTLLHLPIDTISVVTDTRYVYQPVTRLSKTKGKIAVVIQVGNNFVQVTTTRKQEIIPNLDIYATVNDIFKITEIDEAPTSLQTQDDSAFGLRTDSGKIVMYFVSPRKTEILQSIRNSKSKYTKDSKLTTSIERSIRPQDVPGTLLNIALTNMASTESRLRLEAYNLLCALSKTFKFDSCAYISSKEMLIPTNSSRFITDVSKKLALSEPRLTADFINEFFVGWDSFPPSQRPLNLAYLSPWLSGLKWKVLSAESDAEKGRERVAAICRKLIDIAISDSSLSLMLEQLAWPRLCDEETQVDILVDEIIRSALISEDSDGNRIQALGTILSSLKVVTVAGKVVSRLRKAIDRTSLRPTRLLVENAVYKELSVLLKLCLTLSFGNAVQAHIFFPEIAHIITMLANSGAEELKEGANFLLVNTIHVIMTEFSLDESKLSRLQAILSTVSSSENAQHASISSISSDGIFSVQASEHTIQLLASTETLALLLIEVGSLAAPSGDLANVWHARWMSLVTSTAFQTNPAIQPRAFTVMGCLAREDVDDDLLYQVLVALRNSLSNFSNELDNDMLASIIASLTKMMEKLPVTSRYGLQLFWLAISLVRLVPVNIFTYAVSFLEAVVLNINASGDLKDGRMVQVLLSGRLPLEESAAVLDESYGIRFNMDNFHFAVCSVLAKGLSKPSTRAVTFRVLSTFLQVSAANASDSQESVDNIVSTPYLLLLLSRASTLDEVPYTLWHASIHANKPKTLDDMLEELDLSTLKDKELLLNTAIGIVDCKSFEENVQIRGLNWLHRVSVERPTVILHLLGPIFRVLDYVMNSSQNHLTLRAAQTLLQTLATHQRLADTVDTAHLLEQVLEDLGFLGLWRSTDFYMGRERDRERCNLTEKLIELAISL